MALGESSAMAVPEYLNQYEKRFRESRSSGSERGRSTTVTWMRYCGIVAKAGGKQRKQTSSWSHGSLLSTRNRRDICSNVIDYKHLDAQGRRWRLPLFCAVILPLPLAFSCFGGVEIGLMDKNHPTQSSQVHLTATFRPRMDNPASTALRPEFDHFSVLKPL